VWGYFFYRERYHLTVVEKNGVHHLLKTVRPARLLHPIVKATENSYTPSTQLKNQTGNIREPRP
jgi:hypothetical protein